MSRHARRDVGPAIKGRFGRPLGRDSSGRSAGVRIPIEGQISNSRKSLKRPHDCASSYGRVASAPVPNPCRVPSPEAVRLSLVYELPAGRRHSHGRDVRSAYTRALEAQGRLRGSLVGARRMALATQPSHAPSILRVASRFYRERPNGANRLSSRGTGSGSHPAHLDDAASPRAERAESTVEGDARARTAPYVGRIWSCAGSGVSPISEKETAARLVRALNGASPLPVRARREPRGEASWLCGILDQPRRTVRPVDVPRVRPQIPHRSPERYGRSDRTGSIDLSGRPRCDLDGEL